MDFCQVKAFSIQYLKTLEVVWYFKYLKFLLVLITFNMLIKKKYMFNKNKLIINYNEIHFYYLLTTDRYFLRKTIVDLFCLNFHYMAGLFWHLKCFHIKNSPDNSRAIQYDFFDLSMLLEIIYLGNFEHLQHRSASFF